MPASIFHSKNPDPFALGKYRYLTGKFRIAAWVCLIFAGLIFLDSYFTTKLDQETVLVLDEKLEYVKTGGKYGGSKPRSYFELETENLQLRLSPQEVVELNIKPGDDLHYWRTFLFRQRVLLAANGNGFTYKTFAEGKLKDLLYLQGIMAIVGLLAFIPGQIRQMAIIISGLISLFFLLGIL